MILHGDNLSLLKLLPNEHVNLIVTDPPYGILYKSNMQGYDNRGEKTRKLDKEQYFSEIVNDERLPIEWLSEAYRVLKNDSAMYVFCHWRTYPELYFAVEKAGFCVKNLIVMNKSNSGMGDLFSYAPKHELLLFATKGRHRLNTIKYGRPDNVWNVKVKFSGAHRFHPNEKPVEWLVPCLLNSTNEGDLVLDPFAGSGTTGVACVRTNRKYLLIEIDSEHFKTIEKRIKTAEMSNRDIFV